MADQTLPSLPPGFQLETPPSAGPVYGTPPKPDVPTGYRLEGGGLAPIPGGPADPTHTPASAPSGYRFKPDGSLEAIPGGPADAKVNGQSLSPDAVDAETTNWLLSGKMSSLGMGGGAIRVQILNNRPLIMKKYGITDNQLPAIQREFNSDADTFAQRNAQLSYMKQSADAVNQHIQNVADSIKQLPAQSDFTGTNAIATGIAGAFSNKAVVDLQGQIPLLESEIARLMTGNPTTGAGQLTDEARKEFAVISGNASPQSKIDALNKIVQMTQQKMEATQAERNRLEARMNGGLGTYAHDILGQQQGGAQSTDQHGAQQQNQQGIVPPPPGSNPPPPGSGTPPTDPGTRNVGLFGDQSGYNPKGAEAFHDALYSAARSGQIGSVADAQKWAQSFDAQNGTDFTVADTPLTRQAIAAAAAGKPFSVDIPQMTTGQAERLQQRIATNKAGGSKQAAVAAGAADVALLGAPAQIAGLTDATNDFLHGSGFDYSGNLNADQAYLQNVQSEHPNYYLGGQVAGGFALPLGIQGVADAARAEALARGATGEAANLFAKRAVAAQLSKAGAGYGAAYGFNSSAGQPLTNRAESALTGGVAGAVLPMALQGVGRVAGAAKNALFPVSESQSLIDPATGEVNDVLDRMRPGQRAQAIADAGVTTQTPGMSGGRSARIVDQALTRLPGSAGVMEDAYSAANRQLRQGAANVADQYGNSASLADAGSKVQSAVLGYKSRFEAVADQMSRRIPIKPDTESLTFNTQSYLNNVLSRFGSNTELQNTLRDPTLSKYAAAFNTGKLSWEDLRAFRSEIGNQIGERSLMGGDGPAVSQLKGLYAALSSDMEDTARQRGPAALNALQKFNSFYENGRLTIDNALSQFLGKELNNQGAMSGAEAAAAKVQALAKSGRGSADFQTLAALRSATQKSGVWGDIASTLIRLGGKPAGGEGREFSPQTFVNWYAGMTNDSRNLLFGGENSQLRQSLDKFVAVNKQLSKLKALSNTSNTASTLLGGELLLGVSDAVTRGDIHGLGMAGAQVAGSYGMAKLWTWPTFVNWATGFSRAAASGNANAVKSQVGRLTRLATTNPTVRGEIVSLQQRLISALNDNAPQAGSAVASPDQGPQQQQ